MKKRVCFFFQKARKNQKNQKKKEDKANREKRDAVTSFWHVLFCGGQKDKRDWRCGADIILEIVGTHHAFQNILREKKKGKRSREGCVGQE